MRGLSALAVMRSIALRAALALVALLLLGRATAVAQYRPSCDAPPSYPTPGYCQQPPPCQPPCQPPDRPRLDQPPETPYVPRQMGAYVTPPRSGVMRGPVNFAGLDFGTITLPELKLKFPSIELPACFSGRSDARLMMDSGVAPWQVYGVENAAAVPAEEILRAEVGRLQDELKRRGATDPRSAEECAAAERSACEEYTQKLRQYEEQLRRINAERQALEQCIRQCLEAHNRAADIPPADMNCVGPRKGPQQAPESLPYQPLPSKDGGALHFRPPAQPAIVRPATAQAAAQYFEQPAAFITEPARLPERHWIREPAAQARITGLRPVAP